MIQYVPADLGIQFSGNAWNDLFEKLSNAEYEYQEQRCNARTLFWWKVGDRQEDIQAWVALIPDAYGLSVVKASVALLLHVTGPEILKHGKLAKYS